MIEAVLFDIDGTLLDHEAAAAAALRAALAAEHGDLGDAVHDAALAEWRRLEGLHYDTYLSGEIDLVEQRRRRSAGILDWLEEAPRDGDGLDRFFEGFMTAYRSDWRAYEDAIAALDALEQGGFGLGVITNADAAVQRRKLAALGVEHRLPAFVASSTAGYAKPQPEIFLAGCELLTLPPACVAYVGDRLDTDARGARDAGLLGVWLDREGERRLPAERGEDPGVPVITTLADLGPALQTAA